MKNKVTFQLALVLGLTGSLMGCGLAITKDLWDKASLLCDGLGGVDSMTNKGYDRFKTNYFVAVKCKSGAYIEATVPTGLAER